MNRLIVYTHLNPESFTKAVVEEVERVSSEAGHETRVIDLYADGFDPVLKFPDIQYSFMGGEAPSDVKAYQEHIAWADHLVFVYPIWWEQMPAILKGFVDRVFTKGFAFDYDEGGVKGLLGAKSAHLFINTGDTSENLKTSGIHAAVRKVNEDGIFAFCGMKAETTFFGGISMGTDEDRKGYLRSIGENMASSL